MTRRQRRSSGRTLTALRRRRRRRLAGARTVLEKIFFPVRRDFFVFSEIVARQPETVRILS